jgi:hypothetical protein
MTVSRRSMLKLGMVAAAATIPVSRGFAAKRPVLVVYDSRVPESVAFAKTHGVRSIDLAHEHGTLWRNLRGALPKGRIVGMTRWSDLVVVRGVLEEKGRRLVSEAQSSSHAPFVWEMV